MRQIVLDTETTGLEADMGHRIIEIGAVEMINRKLTGRHFHKYVNPQRDIDDGALEVHGITQAFLEDKPEFAAIADELIQFIDGADLIIHNASFDVSFLNYEFKKLKTTVRRVEQICKITDSLALARHKHPGQKNNLDALCRRYLVDNSQRQQHGALLDAEILADVYLLMTGGQTQLFGQANRSTDALAASALQKHEYQMRSPEVRLKLVVASSDEIAAHESYLDFLTESCGQTPVWRQ